MNYILHLIILLEIYAILSLSLNLMVGYTGLLSLAHAAFYGLGAYIASLLMMNFGWGFLPSLIAAMCGTLIISFLISSASLRFHSDHFVLMTLAFQIITFSILYNWISVTNGPFGIAGIPKPDIAGFQFSSLISFSILGFIITVVLVLFLKVIFNSPFGRTLQAIRDDELAALSLGKSISLFKIQCVAIASCCAAIAGVLFATYMTYIDPTSFTLDESILILSMVIVGGTGNIKGPIAGALILVLMPEALRFLMIPDSVAANVRMIIYGILLVVLMRFRPQGVAGKYQFE